MIWKPLQKVERHFICCKQVEIRKNPSSQGNYSVTKWRLSIPSIMRHVVTEEPPFASQFPLNKMAPFHAIKQANGTTEGPVVASQFFRNRVAPFPHQSSKRRQFVTEEPLVASQFLRHNMSPFHAINQAKFQPSG